MSGATPGALAPLAQLVDNLGALLVDTIAAPTAVQTLRTHLRLDGLDGHALAGLGVAVWDALAQACGVPLVELLGGERRPVRAYASLRTMSPPQAVAEAEQAERCDAPESSTTKTCTGLRSRPEPTTSPGTRV